VSDDPQNLGGVWYGRYDARGHADTNNFVARLDDNGGAISGTITEPDTSGGTGVRRAFVSGTRSASGLRFVKQYDGGALAHAVRYSGQINSDATEISGTWIIVNHHGIFTIRREKFAEIDLEREEEVELVGPQDALFIR
jgi:hypothetical protein